MERVEQYGQAIDRAAWCATAYLIARNRADDLAKALGADSPEAEQAYEEAAQAFERTRQAFDHITNMLREQPRESGLPSETQLN